MPSVASSISISGDSTAIASEYIDIETSTDQPVEKNTADEFNTGEDTCDDAATEEETVDAYLAITNEVST